MAFCSSCGKEMPADSQFCPSCGANTQTGAPAPSVTPQPMQQNMGMQNLPDVPNHLVKSIIVTVFCCWPLGIFSILNAAKVDSFLRQGDVDGAIDASEKANKFANWGMIGAGVVFGLYFIFIIIAVVLAESGGY